MSAQETAPNPSPDSESLVKRLAGPSTTKAGYADVIELLYEHLVTYLLQARKRSIGD